jgi:hypothetical protein
MYGDMDRSASPDARDTTPSLAPVGPPTPLSDEPAPNADGRAPANPEAPGASVPRPTGRRRRLARRALGGFVALGLVAGIFTAGVGIDRTGLLGGPASQPTPADAGDFALVREASTAATSPMGRSRD